MVRPDCIFHAASVCLRQFGPRHSVWTRPYESRCIAVQGFPAARAPHGAIPRRIVQSVESYSVRATQCEHRERSGWYDHVHGRQPASDASSSPADVLTWATMSRFKTDVAVPGEKKTVAFSLPAEKLSFWDTNKKAFVVEPGAVDVFVGSSSEDIRARGRVDVAMSGQWGN